MVMLAMCGQCFRHSKQLMCKKTYYVANMQAFVVSSIIQRYSLMQAAALTFLEASQQEVIQ